MQKAAVVIIILTTTLCFISKAQGQTQTQTQTPAAGATSAQTPSTGETPAAPASATGAQQSPAPDSKSSETAEALARKYFELWNTGDKASIESFPDFVMHNHGARVVVGHDMLERVISTWRKSLPDLTFTIDDKFAQLRTDPEIDSQLLIAIDAAMRALSETMTRWRHSHYGIAKKYLGEGGSGTGYTEGTPYLKSVKDLAVFTTVSPIAVKPARQH